MTEDIRAQKENTVRLFLLEDDDAIGMGLKYSLEKEGYDVIHVKTKRDALESLKENEFDMCILDINLPDGNGYDVCRYIKESKDIPIIFLTASDAEVNVVMGLEMGADDYICKPFRINELMARIKTVLRRSSKGKTSVTSEPDGILRIKNICIHTNEAKVGLLDESG